MKYPPLTRRHFVKNASLWAAGGLSAKLPARCEISGPLPKDPLEAGRPHISVCIDALFTKLPLVERLVKVREAGVKAFEFWGWRGRDLAAIRAKREELGLTLAAISCDSGGPLVAPNSKTKFLPALTESIAAARQAGCTRLIVTVGNALPGVDRQEQHRNIVAALRAGAPLCEEAGVVLCLEPLNVLVNHRGYFLASSAEAFEIVDEVASSNVGVLFDVYHQQITEGNLIANLTKHIRQIVHFHVADVPGRHHLGSGEINYENVFRSMVEVGYTGFIGLEMWPTIDPITAVRHASKLLYTAILAHAPAGRGQGETRV